MSCSGDSSFDSKNYSLAFELILDFLQFLGSSFFWMAAPLLTDLVDRLGRFAFSIGSFRLCSRLCSIKVSNSVKRVGGWEKERFIRVLVVGETVKASGSLLRKVTDRKKFIS